MEGLVWGVREKPGPRERMCRGCHRQSHSPQGCPREFTLMKA